MKKWRLKYRILFLSVFPAFVIASLLGALLLIGGLTEIDDALKTRGKVIARQLAPASEYGIFSGNREILQALAQAVMKEDDIKAVTIADDRNKILAVSGNPSPFDTNDAHAAAGSDALIFSAPIYQNEIELDDFGLLGPAAGNGGKKKKLLGRVYVEMSTASTQPRKNRFIAISAIIGIVGLLGAFWLALRMSRDLTRPLSRLLDAVTRMIRGDLDARVTTDSGGGELAELENGFNLMCANLQSVHATMQERIDQATALLADQASRDTLTSLANRREFEMRLERALARTREAGTQHALCYMDLDQFKIVNDTCGHGAGDKMLRQLALLLHGCVRERDTLARVGGDEFSLLLENCSLDTARQIVELLREAVANFRFVCQGKVFRVGISIGLVPINNPAVTLAGIMSAADAACYIAKGSGGNRVHVAEADNHMMLPYQGEMSWATRITEALEENRVHLYGQRIMPLQPTTGDEEHHEVLLRIYERDGMITPALEFITALERHALMPAIDRWVIHAAFGVLRRQLDKGMPQLLSINLSGPSLGDPALLAYIQQQFAAHALQPRCVCFEFSESAAMASLGETIKLVTELKKMGCHICLDDFGAGMLPLVCLKSLAVDYIKIDGALVSDMLLDPVDYAMVQSLHTIGQAMGLKTIAKFVASEEIMAKLQAMGIHCGQGYWIGKPRPLDEL